jgi:hypothetical protein
VSMDFITTLLVRKENHDAVMVIVDKITKLVMFIPTRTDMGTVETAKKFFIHWYRWFGLPKKIISDMDGRFINRFWKELFRLAHTRLAMSTNYHPQTDGQTEKENSVERFDFEACLRVSAFQFTRGSALYRE